LKLGNHLIGIDQKPYFIAEMSGNHGASLDKALKIVEAAAKSGADALKIQTYTPNTMTLNIGSGDFFISDTSSPWYGQSLYELYASAMTPWEWHEPIRNKCHELGITFFSTPFDATAVDFLEELNVPFYKIASFEISDLPLLKKVAQTGKPVIISTGMASIIEIQEAVDTVRLYGSKEIVLLKCTSAYPAKPEDANLLTIKNMRDTFGVEVGLSDHTLGCSVPIAAVTLGASVIEKHFTLRRSDGGVDSNFSLEPAEFLEMTEYATKAKLSLGKIQYGVSKSEANSLMYKRSIYFVKNIAEGEVITPEHIKIIRPGFGLAPKFFDQVLGRTSKGNYSRGTALSWDKL
jgi:pseudaminic acid synthase